jgi:hypothetical protein
VEEDRP